MPICHQLANEEPLLQLADVVVGTYLARYAKSDRLRDSAFDDRLLYAMFSANETSNVMVSRRLGRYRLGRAAPSFRGALEVEVAEVRTI
jgi:hypothetical protein